MTSVLHGSTTAFSSPLRTKKERSFVVLSFYRPATNIIIWVSLFLHLISLTKTHTRMRIIKIKGICRKIFITTVSICTKNYKYFDMYTDMWWTWKMNKWYGVTHFFPTYTIYMARICRLERQAHCLRNAVGALNWPLHRRLWVRKVFHILGALREKNEKNRDKHWTLPYNLSN